MSDLQEIVLVIDAAASLAQKLREAENRDALTAIIAAVKALRQEATLENAAKLATEIESALRADSLTLDVTEAAENFCLAVCEAIADEVPLEADELWDEALAEVQ
jgi:isocitrate dehydrogenase